MDNQETRSYIFYALGQLSRRMLRPRPGNELSPSELAVLWTLDHASDSAAYPSNISELMGIQRPSLTPLLRSLESKGLIERQPDQLDGRRSRIALTERCRDVRQRISRRRLERFSSLLDQLDDGEIAELARLLRKLETADPAGESEKEERP